MAIFNLVRPSRAIVSAAGLVVGLGLFADPAAATVYTTKCGASIATVYKTSVNGSYTVKSSTYVNVPGASVKVVVPAGQIQCLKIRFSLVGSCTVPSAVGHCMIKVQEETASFPIDPAVAYASDEPTAAAHAFEWATRLTAGAHTFHIMAVSNSNVQFQINNWALVVETAK